MHVFPDGVDRIWVAVRKNRHIPGQNQLLGWKSAENCPAMSAIGLKNPSTGHVLCAVRPLYM